GKGWVVEATWIYISAKVGTGKGPEIVDALDPMEGTTLTAKGGPNALAVNAFAQKGNFLNAPDTYMEKIAVGGGYPEGIIDIDRSAGENLRAIAEAKGVPVNQTMACVLDRPRPAGTNG